MYGKADYDEHEQAHCAKQECGYAVGFLCDEMRNPLSVSLKVYYGGALHIVVVLFCIKALRYRL